MKILFWNIRGLNSGGRKKQLGELLSKHQVDVVCLQETIKQKFTNRELTSLAGGQDMPWEWIRPEGRSGGLLIGADKDCLEITEYKVGRFIQCLSVKSKEDWFSWGIINVYGPVQVDLKPEFLRELMEMILSLEVPVIVGGDFNLVRDSSEKSTGNVNSSLVSLFNYFVNDTSLREMHRHGGAYTWTNKQSSPIMAVLDRVFISEDWEEHFPLATARSLTRVGSDHNPLLVETDSGVSIRSSIFKFENAWLNQEGLKEWVIQKWPQRQKSYVLDHWRVVSSNLRRLMKGWSRNWGSDQRKLKQELLLQIEKWDKLAEERVLSNSEWSDRYEKEDELMKIYENEELLWQRIGGENWLLKGDANTGYFHGIANGRKRKCHIRNLVDGDRTIEDKEELKVYVTDFYKHLFGGRA